MLREWPYLWRTCVSSVRRFAYPSAASCCTRETSLLSFVAPTFACCWDALGRNPCRRQTSSSASSVKYAINNFYQINFASTLFFLNWYINKYQAALTAGQNFITLSDFMRSVWQTEANTDVKKELEVVPQFNFWLTLFSPPCLTGEIFLSTHWCVGSVQLIQLTGVSEQNTQKKEVFYDRVGPVLSFLHCFSRTVLCAGKPVWFHNSMANHYRHMETTT